MQSKAAAKISFSLLDTMDKSRRASGLLKNISMIRYSVRKDHWFQSNLNIWTWQTSTRILKQVTTSSLLLKSTETSKSTQERAAFKSSRSSLFFDGCLDDDDGIGFEGGFELYYTGFFCPLLIMLLPWDAM